MHDLIHLLAHNDVVIAIAAAVSIISFLLILCPALWRFARFLYDVATKGWVAAKWKRNRRVVKLAVACSENTTVFISTIFGFILIIILFASINIFIGLIVLIALTGNPALQGHSELAPVQAVLSLAAITFTGTLTLMTLPVVHLCLRVRKVERRRQWSLKRASALLAA